MKSSNFHGVGRRKSSVARVWLKAGKGDISVNGTPYKTYFDTEFARLKVEQPFLVTGLQGKFDINVNTNGGGLVSQADAVKLGISRALLSGDENLRSELRKHGLLTVDARIKERKKYGQKAARRKFQFVKR